MRKKVKEKDKEKEIKKDPSQIIPLDDADFREF